jgi:hypothetical protein
LKKIAAISFLFVFVCAHTEIGQLLKLPVLLHHYLVHEEEDDNTTSFVDFLYEHYLEGSSHSSTDNEHQKLPFKSVDFSFAQSNFILETPFTFTVKPDKPIPSKINTIYSETSYSSSISPKIWQPPKSC